MPNAQEGKKDLTLVRKKSHTPRKGGYQSVLFLRKEDGGQQKGGHVLSTEKKRRRIPSGGGGEGPLQKKKQRPSSHRGIKEGNRKRRDIDLTPKKRKSKGTSARGEGKGYLFAEDEGD